jgi:DNA (cytosine-5)-methyltransferase 1
MPRILDLFCGQGGAAMGYHRAGFEVVGVDLAPQPRYPFEFHQADAMTFPLTGFDAVHCSPPCQGYSIMNNLPWLAGKERPLLLLDVLARLEGSGLPYVVENVMGARYGAAGLRKRGLEAHGLKAGYLCGLMFGLPFYRHRLFATNWLWLAPGHPKHTLNLHPRAERSVYGGTVKGLPGGAAGLDVKPRTASQEVSLRTADARGLETWPGRREQRAGLTAWHNGAQAAGVGIGHAKGWRLAAEAMGIDWMDRGGLTQAIPPAFAEFIGRRLILEVQ